MFENIIAVLSVVCVSLLLSFIAVLIVAWLEYRNVSVLSLRRTISLHSSQGLARQGLFWVVIIAPLIHFIVFGFMSWRDYDVLLNAEGFKNFISISALPLGLLGVALPLSALVAKLHSTAQAAKQIELSEEKNKHDLFYLHRKEFVSYYDLVGETSFPGGLKTLYKMNPRVHARLFIGRPATGTPLLNEGVMDMQVSRMRVARRCLKKVLAAESSDLARKHYIVFCRNIFKLIHFFNIKDVEVTLLKEGIPLPGKYKGRTIGSSSIRAIDGYLCVENYLTSALEFSGYTKGLSRLHANKLELNGVLTDINKKRVIEDIFEDLK